MQLREVGLPELQSPTVTTDNTSNIHKAFNEFIGWDWLPCACHTPQLAVGRTLSTCCDQVKKLVADCSEIESVFHLPPAAWEQFRAL